MMTGMLVSVIFTTQLREEIRVLLHPCSTILSITS